MAALDIRVVSHRLEGGMLAELSATRPLSVLEQKRLQALGVILNQEGRAYLHFVGAD
ncbi:MAG: hypothetical protein KDI15_13620 [Thiothrix sp.]|nr:hypothetical protein [Thiothrix sp.]HPE58786.1 hypothetical protein [Thiolinea sp.]